MQELDGGLQKNLTFLCEKVTKSSKADFFLSLLFTCEIVKMERRKLSVFFYYCFLKELDQSESKNRNNFFFFSLLFSEIIKSEIKTNWTNK